MVNVLSKHIYKAAPAAVFRLFIARYVTYGFPGSIGSSVRSSGGISSTQTPAWFASSEAEAAFADRYTEVLYNCPFGVIAAALLGVDAHGCQHDFPVLYLTRKAMASRNYYPNV